MKIKLESCSGAIIAWPINTLQTIQSGKHVPPLCYQSASIVHPPLLNDIELPLKIAHRRWRPDLPDRINRNVESANHTTSSPQFLRSAPNAICTAFTVVLEKNNANI